MVDGGKITLRIEVDAKEFKRLMKGSTQDLTKFKQQVDNTTPAMNKLGDTATTTAVRFQTLTQGTINLVTSFTQAYTSISNLQKAKTSLQASAVGVERAIDLQRRKQFMLNEEMKKAAPNMKKVELLTNELATAHDDLAVKQQRVKDQADQVNDTYILFGLNIANVGFSAVQTGASMIQMTKGIKLATVASTAFNVVTSKYTLIALGAIVVWEGLAQVIKIFNKDLGESISIISNVTKLMDEFTGASDITLDHYDSKIGGVTQSTTDFEDSWKSMTKTVQQETTAQTDLVKHWERQYKRSVANIQIEMGRQKQITSGTTGGTQVKNSQAQQGVEAKIQETDNKIDAVLKYLTHSGPLSMPAVAAEEQLISNVDRLDDNIQQIKADPNYVGSDYSALKNQLTPELYLAIHKGNLISDTSTVKGFTKFKTPGLAGFFGHETVSGVISTPDYVPPSYITSTVPSAQLPDVPSEAEKIQAEIDNLRKIEQELVNDYERHGGNVVWTWYTAAGNTSLQILDLESELDALTERNPKIKPPKPKSKDERNQEFLSTFIDENTPAYQLRLGSMSSQKRGLFKQRNEKLKQLAIQKFAKENFPRTIQFGTQSITTGRTSPLTGTGVFYGGTGGKIIAGMQNIMGGTFGMGNRRLGTSEGNMIEALRRAQMATIDPNATRDTNLARQTMAEFNAMNEGGNTSDMSRFRGQVRRSQTLEVLRRNAKTLADNKLRNQIKDANTNRLRWGGKLREGMSIYDEGAVVGGYGSAKEFSRAGKQRQSKAFIQAQIFSDYFTGIGRVSSYTGMSDLRGQLGGIKQRADTIKNALSSAGLSYKTFNARTGLPHRASAQQSYQFYRDWNAVKAFNDNQYAKAREINLLQQDFGVTGFTGSALTLPSLQDEVAKQDALIKSIGLDRTEAFQIVDTAGRGREEIDDRIRFKDRMNSISTGVSVL